MEPQIDFEDTIVAVSTPFGTGGIAVIRLSGADALSIASRAWKGADLAGVKTHTAHLGTITAADGAPLDQAVATVFRAPRSFTGEDMVDFSGPGPPSPHPAVVERLVELGARPAQGGEFSRRAFINGKMDLAQAEGVADLIAADSRAAHRLAMTQVNGRFSGKLESLREQLVQLASLLELELDFSEEEVEFAERGRLSALCDEIIGLVDSLARSYDAGKVLKEGVPVAIAGAPNAGKSTLLNALLDQDKAIVSDIPGTTRDLIEDTCEIDGVLYRFTDTAGLRESTDPVERIGIERAREAIGKARIILWLIDATETAGDASSAEGAAGCDKKGDSAAAGREERGDSAAAGREERGDSAGAGIAEIAKSITEKPDTNHIIILTKTDKISAEVQINAQKRIEEQIKSEIAKLSAAEAGSCQIEAGETCPDVEAGSWCVMAISAKEGRGLEELKGAITATVEGTGAGGDAIIVTNARHHAALLRGGEALKRVKEGIDAGISADFIAQDIRESLQYIGEITGAVTTDHLLQSIFTRFCIGK